MALVHQFLASLRRDEEGQGLAEYALILALIAIIAIIALIFLGGQVSDPQQRRQLDLTESLDKEPPEPSGPGGFSIPGFNAAFKRVAADAPHR